MDIFSFLFGRYLEIELLNHIVTQYLHLKKLPHFSKVDVPFNIPTSNV